MFLSVTDQDFDSTLDSNGVTVVFFHAPWCASCKSMAPMIIELANEKYMHRVRFLGVDADSSPDLATRFSVCSLPYFLIFKDGQLVNQQSGAMSKHDLEHFIEGVLI